ncbi:MAG: hypothetical protein U5O39_11910 [Gammaproteobacteria bacterium]|nr:hypothetical protein [Gammaproteobacteria bacterium]
MAPRPSTLHLCYGTTPASHLTAQTGTSAVTFVTGNGTLTIGSTLPLASDGDVIGVTSLDGTYQSVTGQHSISGSVTDDAEQLPFSPARPRRQT